MTTINSSPDPRINLSQTANGSDLTTEQITPTSSEFQLPDALDSGHVVVQQFLSVARWGKKEYQADLRHPTLLPPDTNEGGPTPLDQPWQKAINQQFRDLIKSHLLKKIKEGKKTAETPQEHSKALPQEKPISQKDEKPNQEQDSLLLSESQIERKVNTLLHAVAAGKESTLSEEDQKNVSEATKTIQKTFHLPTWKFGTLEAKDLTPTKEIDPPIEVTTARTEIFLENMDKLAISTQKAADKMVKETAENDPNNLAVGDLVKMIALAISELKQVLQDMQISESKINSKMAIAKRDQQKEHLDEVYKALEKQKKIERKMRKQKKIAGIMKIVAPVVSGLVAIAAVAFCIASGGLGAPAAIIAIAVVSTILFAYTIVDSQEGYTQLAIEAFNNSMEETFPDKLTRDIVKGLILSVIAALMILMITLSGGGAAASTGTAAANATAAEVAKEVALQLTIQTSMMFIMSSNILPDLVIDSCVAAGAVSKDDQETIMIIRMIVMALTLILCMEAMAKGQGLLGSGATMMKDSAQGAMKNVQTAVRNMREMTTETVKKSFDEFIKAFQAMLNDLYESGQAAYANALKFSNEAMSQTTLDRIKQTMAGLKDIFTNQKDLAKIAHNCEDIFKMGGLGVNAGYSIYLGTLSLQLADLFKQLGEIEKEKEALQALIQLFEKLLSSMQGDQTKRAEWINNLTKAMDNMYASESIMSTKITQQYTA